MMPEAFADLLTYGPLGTFVILLALAILRLYNETKEQNKVIAQLNEKRLEEYKSVLDVLNKDAEAGRMQAEAMSNMSRSLDIMREFIASPRSTSTEDK